MAITLKQFAECVRASGLISADRLDSLLHELPSEQQPQDAAALARLLVQRRELTEYQARHLYRGRAQGLVLGDYIILDKIGQGGMGSVFRARHRRMKRLVALKFLLRQATASDVAVKRFYREVEAVAKLTHPNIVAAYDAGEADGTHYLVMEFVDGQDLSSLLTQKGSFGIEQAIDCAIQAATGLQYAHDKGIYHRDVKPGNLLLDQDGVVKVLDLGLARFDQSVADEAADDDALTQTNQIMGTLDYMAPEQALNTSQADHRSDIYSLGCTLYTLLTNQYPFGGNTMMEKLLAHREASVPSLADVRADVPQRLGAVVARMMAKQPEDRYQTMGEVIQALQSCCSGVSQRQAVTATMSVAPTDVGDAQARVSSPTPEAVVTPPPPPLPPTAMVPTLDLRHGSATQASIDVGATGARPRKRFWLVGGSLFCVFLLLVVGVSVWMGSEPKDTEKDSGSSVATQPVTVDLIDTIDLGRDTVEGEWKRVAQVLISPPPTRGFEALARLGKPQQLLDRLQLPLTPPAEYDLVVEVQRLQGRGPLLIGLVAGKQFGVILDFAGISGLERIDDKPILQNSTLRRGPIFAEGKETAVICRVRRDSLQVQCDDQTVIYWDGGFDRLSLPPTWRVPKEDCLILGSLGASFSITKLAVIYEKQILEQP